MRRVGLASLVLFLLLGAHPVLADTWGIAPVESVNLHAEYANVVRVLLSQHLTELGIVVVPAGEEGDAFEAGAVAVVKVAVVRLGEKVKVTAQVVDRNGKVLGAASMTASSPDDLDNVMGRVARSLVSGENPREGETIYDVTAEEQDHLKKKKSTMYWGLGIMGETHFTSELNQQPVKPGFTVFALYDPRFFLAEISTSFAWGSSGDFDEFSWNLGVSGYYPFTQTNFTPYVGGGAFLTTRSSGWTENDGTDVEEGRDATDFGISLHAAAGILLGRTSDVLIRGEVRFFVDTFEVENKFSCGLLYSASIGF